MLIYFILKHESFHFSFIPLTAAFILRFSTTTQIHDALCLKLSAIHHALTLTIHTTRHATTAAHQTACKCPQALRVVKPTGLAVCGHTLQRCRVSFWLGACLQHCDLMPAIKATRRTSAHTGSSINPLQPAEAAFSDAVGHRGWQPWEGDTNSV